MGAAAAGLSLAAALLLAPACEAQSEGGETGGVHLELMLRDAEGRKVDRCTRGHASAFLLVVHNPSDEPKQLRFASSKTHDLTVTSAEGDTVWRLSDGRFYAQMLTQLEIPPRGSHEFRGEWSIPADVKPGAYRVRATVPVLGDPLASEALTVRIE